MTLSTKCILEPKEMNDGWRISVLGSHTLSNGVSPDLRIKKGSFDCHCPLLAPNSKLLGDYHRSEITWEDFKKCYLEQLRSNHVVQAQLREIAKMALRSNVTILGIKASPLRCPRSILAEECQRLVPGIVVEIG